MTQFGIIRLHRIRVRLAFRDGISAKVIPKQIIYIEGVREIPVGLGCPVDDGLNGFPTTIPQHFPAQNAVRGPIDDGYNVDPVFFSPMKVKSSSSSAVCTSCGIGASGNFSAYSLTQLATV